VGRVLTGGNGHFEDLAPKLEAMIPGDLPIITWMGYHMGDTPERYYAYNSEDLRLPKKRSAAYMGFLDKAEQVYDYSANNQEFYPRGIFCPLTLDEDAVAAAREQELPEPDIHVLFCGLVTDRRRPIVEAARAEVVTNKFGAKLTDLLRRARYVLSLGAYDSHNNLATRVFPALEAGARGILSEECGEPWFNRVAGRFCEVLSYEAMLARCQTL